MNWVDIAALAVLVLFACVGFKRGLIKEAGSLVAVLLALILSLLLVPLSSKVIDSFGVLPRKFTPWVVALVSFVFLLFLFQLLLSLIHKLVHSTPLALLDRLGGVGFGGVKALVVIGFLLLILSLLPLPRALSSQFESSLLYSTVSELSPEMARWGMRRLKDKVEGDRKDKVEGVESEQRNR